MNQMLKIIAISALSFLMLQCQSINPCLNFPDLGVDPNQPTDDLLRKDGYYYEVVADTQASGVALTEIVILYRNGVALAGSSSGVRDLNELDDLVQSYGADNLYKEARDFWGLFDADSQTIELAHWFPKPCGKTGIRRTGEVLSDTSFILTNKVGTGKNPPTYFSPDIQQTFRFRPFHPKPDSTNDFVP